MKRLKEIFVKNILAKELEDCETCPSKDTCNPKLIEEAIKDSMDETNEDNDEFITIANSIREWYKEKTGQELTD